MGNAKKSITFVRTKKGLGIFSATVSGGEIRIIDRGIYSTSDADEIVALKADPEVEVWKMSDKKLDSQMASQPKDAEIEEVKKPNRFRGE